MFTIGEFAAIGRVSVRMLRHYDGIGLLTPAHVDEHSGYRYYRADQLRRLNRLLALKDLGFTLDQVRQVLDDELTPAELRGMLRLRRAELAERIAADRDRLGRVEARLRIIEEEHTMSTTDVAVKPIPATRIAALEAVVDSAAHDAIGPVVQDLFGRLAEYLQRGEIMCAGPDVVVYTPTVEGGLRCRAGFTVRDGVVPDGVELVGLPAIERAATLVHRGPMAEIGASYQRLAVWIEENGYRTDGSAREVYLVSHPKPQHDWVTELQMPVVG